MRYLFLIFPLLSLAQLASAQTSSSITTDEIIVTSPPAVPNPLPSEPAPAVTSSESDRTSYLDYKSVYEAGTLEEEVKMAAERFKLSASQQEIWLTAAKDRRNDEQQAKVKLESNMSSYEKEPIYRGLRTAQNTFYNTIIGFLSPVQKQAMETDRLILQEKQQRIAKLPPPPPPAPTVTVMPVDSVVTPEPEKEKPKGGSRKKKKQS